MNKLPNRQRGGSIIVTIIMVAVLGFAAYIGIQYVPQMVESKSIDSILDSMEDRQKSDPVTDVTSAKTRLVKLLQVNEMNDMTDGFTVKERDNKITIVFSYDRELNLVYKVHQMHYEKTLSLK